MTANVQSSAALRGGGAAVGRRAQGASEASKGADAIAPSQPIDGSAGGDGPGTLERADLPGALDHAASEVDEFDAALVRGAGGVPATPDTLSEVEIEAEALAEGDIGEDELQEPGGPSGPGRPGGGGGRGGGDGDVSPERPSGAPLRGGNRVVGFLRASWAELQRVQWPDRRQVTQATAVVLGLRRDRRSLPWPGGYVAKEIVEFVL